MQSDELAERVERITRRLLDSSRQYSADEGFEHTTYLLSVLDDVAEGLAALDEGEFEYHVLAAARGSGQMDAAETLRAVRDLHLRREGEGE